jgi:hypothetical protein
MPEETGYPTVVMAFVAVAGVLLLAFRPRLLTPLTWAAILTVDLRAYTFTRVGSGYFLFNLYDLLLLLGLLGALRVGGTLDRIRLLKTPAALCLLLGLGVLSTAFQRDLLYDDLRLLRFALIFPIAWAIGALGTEGSPSARLFLWILAGAVALQSFRQCLYVVEFPNPAVGEGSWRTLRFLNAGLAYVPLTVLLTANRLPGWRRVGLIASTAVAVLALVLTQTRSLWVPQGLVIAALVAWRVARGRVGVLLLVAGLAGAAAVGGGRLLFRLTDARVDPWEVFWEGHATDFSHGTGREEAIPAELNAWLEGNWFLGRGLGFQNGPGMDETLAWGHNGYTSYLANLGLLGFAAYALAVPLLVARWALGLTRRPAGPDRLVGWLGLATVGCCSIQAALSGGLLAGHVFSMYAILAGVVSARARADRLPAPGPLSFWDRAPMAASAGAPRDRGQHPPIDLGP